MLTFALPFDKWVVLRREHSSVGLEHLPYKQRVGGSTPSAPTKVETPSQFAERVFFFLWFPRFKCTTIPME